MSVKRKLWQFACAAMVLIAVQFAPALARAHGNHDHGTGAHGVHAHHGAVSHAIALNGTKASRTLSPPSIAGLETPAKSELVLTANQDNGSLTSDTDGCVSGCCSKGIGCCSAAALASASQSPPVSPRSRRLDLAGPILILGTEPESLRKPPRHLA